MAIDEDPRKLVQALLRTGRPEGLESAVQLGLDLIHYRWVLSGIRGAWAQFILGDANKSSNFDDKATLRPHSLERINVGSRQRLAGAFHNVPADHPQDDELRFFLHLAFEEMLGVRHEQLGRASGENASRHEIAELLGYLAGDGPRLLDPACGLGTSLLASTKSTLRSEVVGYDINQAVVSTAAARFELAAIDANLIVRDWLVDESFGEWDSICLEPPFSLHWDESQVEANPEFGSRSDMVWLFRAVRGLAPFGRAVVILPSRTLYATNEERYRSELLEGDLIESIVTLPANASLGTSIETCIWILRGTQDPTKTNKVLLVNGESLFSGDEAFQASEVARVIAITSNWRETSELLPTDKWRAGIVSHDALRSSQSFSPTAHLGKPPVVTEPRPSPPGRGLTELRLRGFKAVDQELKVPLKPLTLIFGRNSAGKSSLIQSLLLLRESLHQSGLVTRGEGFDLGNFRGLVNRHDTTRAIEIGVTFASAPYLDSNSELTSPSLLRSVDLQFDQVEDGSTLSTNSRIGFGEAHFDFRRSEHLAGEPFTLAGEAAVELVKLISTEAFTFPPRTRSASADRRVKSALNRLGLNQVAIPANGSIPGKNISIDFSRVESEHRKGLEQSALGRAIRTTAAVTDELQTLLDRAVYLGPLRQPPQRFSSRSESKSAIDLPFFLLDNVSERELITRWMHRLEMLYDLDVLSFAATPGAHVLGEIASVILVNKQMGITLSTADVGFGVSQVLPILVELSARRESTILIEQPEIHLHPAMQSNLADIMIESIDEAGRGNQIIAETHSEHIMLRIQRRIREKELDPESVVIIYVEQNEDGSAIAHELRLDENGEFIDEWPRGFFVERFDEMFSGLL